MRSSAVGSSTASIPGSTASQSRSRPPIVGGLNDTFGTNRANLVGDPRSGDRTVTRWFNTAAFAQPAAGALGNLGRNTERGPGVNNLDLALFKNFNLGMGARLQFRLESFNVFNHTQFAGVSTNIAATNFGVVTSARPARINQLGVQAVVLRIGGLVNCYSYPPVHRFAQFTR